MDVTHAETVDEVREVVVSVLGIEDRAAALDASTPLLDNLPELDSMAVLELVAAIEERFDFTVDDGDVSAELFETLGSLAAFVADRRP
ncbi:acyl carrier protein [Micromonospora craterilacus]|uniref:Acyl carrier protein n=1 Tax=Micromonospora craterilacus TaxID=1655439 RepID=A0A2W2E6C5_9ACTN|nr:phosphopantetheine-binding protein [Micromonospora craterilacus]PZG07548.1 acyl carrier protein [Micromonospora craterilacus]